MIPVSKPSLTRAELEAVVRVMESGQLTQAETVATFETLFSDYFEGGHDVVAVSSGTAALHLALHTLGVRPGDEVLVPDLSFVATTNAVTYCGATPVLVDVDKDRLAIDLRKAERKLTPRTKAIVAVHLYGVPCDVEATWRFAKNYGLKLIEDAAEGLGGTYADRKLGTFGDAACFSFYGNKVITTAEGGAVMVKSGDIGDELRYYRGQAQNTRGEYYHGAIGFNYRMTELQAALGVAQMRRLPELLEQRERVMHRYRMGFKITGFSGQAPWLFTLIVPPHVDVVKLRQSLRMDGIDSRPCFVPMHRLPPYRGSDVDYPISSEMSQRVISLPTFPELAEEDIDRIIAKTMAFIRSER